MFKQKIYKLVRKIILEVMPELAILEILKKEMDRELPSKTIKCDKLMLIGSLVNSKVSIRPEIKPEIILSKFSLESVLNVSGIAQRIENCYFENLETAVKLKK